MVISIDLLYLSWHYGGVGTGMAWRGIQAADAAAGAAARAVSLRGVVPPGRTEGEGDDS